MDAAVACAIAQRVHAGQLDPGREPLLGHVTRVALTSPRRARSVAWLHEVLEQTDISEEWLLTQGLSDDELRALRLLVRAPGDRSVPGYLHHMRMIARSAGPAGTLARDVKRADLMDRVEHPAKRRDGWSPPYRQGLEALAETNLARAV